MKSKTKIKPVKTRKTTKSCLSKKSILIHAGRPVLRHFRLIKHAYTGKIIHHRHTSHLALMVILALLGIFILETGNYTSALSQSGTVSIGVTVPGPAPTVGAVILSPENNFKVKDISEIDISGTCPKETFVVITDNKTPVGSIMCSDSETFSVKIQLFIGENTISALNYDNLNQAGPVTPSIIVNREVSQVPQVVTKAEPVIPTLPVNPSIVPGASASISDCSQYRTGVLPTGGEPHVTVVCLPRLFLPNIKQVMGFVVWGGTPPYAVSIDFGDDVGTATLKNVVLLSVATPGYKTVEFSYAEPKTYKVEIKLKDNEGKASIINTSVQVSGQTNNGNGSTATDDVNTKTVWYNSPVPLYLLAVAITAGFWVGDIFDRRFGAKQQKKCPKLKRVG